MKTIYISHNKSTFPIQLSPQSTQEELNSLLYSIANRTDVDKIVLNLYNTANDIISISPSCLKENTSETPYFLIVNLLGDETSEAQMVLNEINSLTIKLNEIKTLSEQTKNKEKMEKEAASLLPLLANERVKKGHGLLKASPFHRQSPRTVYDQETLDKMKTPSFDIWKYDTEQMIELLEEIFMDFDLIRLFKIDLAKLRGFLELISVIYNANPFHNFRHCFCVTQMMYAILHQSEIHLKLSNTEKLTLVVACIGHDLDHPGFNNAYQINAGTELAIIYNDSSPLEHHHAAVLFSVLREEEFNFLKNLNEQESKEFRRDSVNCILATDMGKHGEITAKFKSHIENFNIQEETQRKLLLQIIIKCADISNEVRPQEVSELWVDNLLNEFFTQSDREKSEGLPTAPFMDRQKVTKPSAQVGFIGFVMIPLFELLGKVLPKIEEKFLGPIKVSLAYYKGLLEKQNVAVGK